MTAAALIDLGEAYLMLGAIVAAAFLVLGLDRVEPNARGAYAFRALLVPGLMLIWPIVLWRWRMTLRGEAEIARHRPPLAMQDRLALALAVAAPLLLLAALAMKPHGPEAASPVLVEAPR
ncbi:MAG: hypothetical protein AAF371_02710 [Pseudomonadota bacterium]